MTTNAGSSGTLHTLPLWLPPSEAAAMLGISERGLRLRAERGDVQRRKQGRCVVYRVERAPMPEAPAEATSGSATAVVPLTAGSAGSIAEVVAALVSAVERATRAEAERDQAIARCAVIEHERDQARAAATDLASALQKRAVIVRDLARRVGALERAR